MSIRDYVLVGLISGTVLAGLVSLPIANIKAKYDVYSQSNNTGRTYINMKFFRPFSADGWKYYGKTLSITAKCTAAGGLVGALIGAGVGIVQKLRKRD